MNKDVYIYVNNQLYDEVIKYYREIGIRIAGIIVDSHENPLGEELEVKKNTTSDDKEIKHIYLKEDDISGVLDDYVIISHKNPIIAAKRLRRYGFKRIIRITNLSENSDDGSFYPDIDNPYFEKVHPFNHYESPYADLEIIEKYQNVIWDKNKIIREIDFNISGIIDFIKYAESIDAPKWTEYESTLNRYYFKNGWYDKWAALGLYYMMRYYKPKRIIEIGSGFSTAAMLDVNQKYFNNSIKIQCIEPRAQRLKSLLQKGDNLSITEENLQDVQLDLFDELEEDDFLFIDSSHVGKTGSDVNMELFDILPRLKNGVIIHFHDIHWPFEYDKKWVFEGRAYNELFLIRAFLMGNHQYRIILFGDMMKSLYNGISPLANIGDKCLWLKKQKID